MKKISARITPESNIKALLIPLVALVSNRTKKTGPIVKDRIIPKGIAVRIASCIKETVSYKFTEKLDDICYELLKLIKQL